jgi:hypothetical protein
MLTNYETIKDYILTLGEFTDSPKLDLQIRALINECLAYCYRSDVPEAMELPLADVVANELHKRNLLGLDGDVSSYREGDMSVSFGSNNNISTAKQFYNGKLEPFKQITGVVKKNV